jgi:hypothetical protein
VKNEEVYHRIIFTLINLHAKHLKTLSVVLHFFTNIISISNKPHLFKHMTQQSFSETPDIHTSQNGDNTELQLTFDFYGWLVFDKVYFHYFLSELILYVDGVDHYHKQHYAGCQ